MSLDDFARLKAKQLQGIIAKNKKNVKSKRRNEKKWKFQLYFTYQPP
jgi:ribosomal protein S30